MSKRKPAPRAPHLSDGVASFSLPRTGAWSVIFFLLLCLCYGSTIKWTAVLALGAAILVMIFCGKELSQSLSLPFLSLSGFVLLCGISTAYALSGKFALNEFLKVLVSFCVFLLLVAFPGKAGSFGRSGATLLSGATALASLFSIDLLSTYVLSGVFQGVMGLFSSEYADLAGVEAGVRMTSIFINPNVFAGCVGLGLLLGLGLANSAPSQTEKCLHQVCLFFNALAFVLVFSMGASGTIAVAFLVMLALEHRDRRPALLILMVETLILTLAAAFPIFLSSFDPWDGIQPIPLLCAVLGSAVLCAADHLLGQKAAAFLGRHGKATALLIAGVLAAVAVFAALSLTLTGSAALDAKESLRRSAYPQAGTYTLDVTASAPVQVTIETQNVSDTMMHTSSILYQGDAQGAAFTVPEDSLVVYFNFFAPDGATLERAAFQGSTGGEELKLGYKLLPGFITNRLQGLFANQNAIQRTVFFRDGLQLFQRSPLFGLGMGSFENAILSVQSFFYETKYVHNHYIQTLLETGVVGLVLFAGTLALSALAIWKTRRQEHATPLLAALGACLVFMAGHAAMEVIFSTGQYLPLAFGVLALICVTCGEALPLPRRWSEVRRLPLRLIRGMAALMAVFLILLGCNMQAASIARRADGNLFVSLKTAIALDRFEWADYMLSYVYNAPEAGSDAVLAQARTYAQRLEKLQSNTVPLYLGEFYLATGDTQKGLDALNSYVDYTASNSDSWNRAFATLFSYSSTADPELYLQGIQDLYDKFQQWNEVHMGKLTLTESNLALLQVFIGIP